MIEVLNIRRGFANNSSSTHSLVFCNDIKRSRDVPNDGYEWEDFILVGDDKLGYLMAQVYGLLPRTEPQAVKDAFMWMLFGDIYFNREYDLHVDHQSQWNIPREYGAGSFPSVQFIGELQQYLMSQSNLIIVGGNDNEGEAGYYGFKLPFTNIAPASCSDIVCRKDGDTWILFNRDNGDKIRFRFVPGMQVDNIRINKAHAPELVDLKITNYCDKECPYCYQGSSRNGKHADNLYIIIDTLAKMQVFEVAIGGGEPTKHPQFLSILEYAREHGITSNFTTRSLDWIDGVDAEKIMRLCGSFAYSVESQWDVMDLHAHLLMRFGRKWLSESSDKVYINIVIGTVQGHVFEKILDAAWLYNFTVTLLGYKDAGQGMDWRDSGLGYRAYPWLKQVIDEALNSCRLPRLGIDTLMAKEMGGILEMLDVDERYYYKEEGKFSMYVDAVNMTMGPHSYCAPEEMVPIPMVPTVELAEFMQDTFAKW